MAAIDALSREARLKSMPFWRPSRSGSACCRRSHTRPSANSASAASSHSRAPAHLPRQQLPHGYLSAARTGCPSAPRGRRFAADRPSAWPVQAAAAVQSRPQGHRRGTVLLSPLNTPNLVFVRGSKLDFGHFAARRVGGGVEAGETDRLMASPPSVDRHAAPACPFAGIIRGVRTGCSSTARGRHAHNLLIGAILTRSAHGDKASAHHRPRAGARFVNLQTHPQPGGVVPTLRAAATCSVSSSTRSRNAAPWFWDWTIRSSAAAASGSRPRVSTVIRFAPPTATSSRRAGCAG